MEKILPNFFLVGAAKAGTTSIYKYMEMSKSPEIFIPENKEPSFFALEGKKIDFHNFPYELKLITRYEDYLDIFRGSESFKIRGDFSTPYLYFYKETVKNIKKYYKNTSNLKFLIILRNPIDRAYSQYYHYVRDALESLSFEEAIKAEKDRMKKNYHFDYFYIDRGFYYKQVKAYLDNFENVKILLFEDLKKNPYKTLEEIFNYLELDTKYLSNIDFNKKFNVSGKPKIKLLSKIIFSKNPVAKAIKSSIPKETREKMKQFIYKVNLNRKEKMKEETREYLKKVYREDIEKLSELIKKDLSHWLK